MKNLLIIHSHNANRGDEAAVRAMVDELLIKYPDASITISNNGFTPYPNMPKQVVQIDRFPKLCSKFAQLEFFIAMATNGRLVFSKEAKAFMKALKNADLVIHAPGGPSIGDIYLDAEKLYLWRLDFIRRLHKPYFFYAPSMGPFNVENRNNLRKRVLRGAEKIILRDPISLRYVKEFLPELEVEQALDSALQHEIDAESNSRKYREYKELVHFMEEHDKCMGITITDLKWHPQHKKTEISKKISGAFHQFIKEKAAEGYGIVFIPQLYGTSNDTKIMNEYMLEKHTFMISAFDEQYDTYFQQYVIGKLYSVVGMRYHSNIFSAKMGTPFVSVSYEQKMKGFMQLIDLNNYCIDIADISVETLNDAFNNLVKNYSDYKKHLRDIHENMKSEAYKSTAAVIDILEEGK